MTDEPGVLLAPHLTADLAEHAVGATMLRVAAHALATLATDAIESYLYFSATIADAAATAQDGETWQAFLLRAEQAVTERVLRTNRDFLRFGDISVLLGFEQVRPQLATLAQPLLEDIRNRLSGTEAPASDEPEQTWPPPTPDPAPSPGEPCHEDEAAEAVERARRFSAELNRHYKAAENRAAALQAMEKEIQQRLDGLSTAAEELYEKMDQAFQQAADRHAEELATAQEQMRQTAERTRAMAAGHADFIVRHPVAARLVSREDDVEMGRALRGALVHALRAQDFTEVFASSFLAAVLPAPRTPVRAPERPEEELAAAVADLRELAKTLLEPSRVWTLRLTERLAGAGAPIFARPARVSPAAAAAFRLTAACLAAELRGLPEPGPATAARLRALIAATLLPPS
ncbi:OmpH family outer membrane protein [Actinomadura macrotermitis]|uniref:Uncharacterized protein n=1 Tax=Actinomadura macrotermitis TaxID=2585200 RepID=A0A7K0BRK6_9ACTN|nr:OmpH family outer membrane protein [Actinomadura macrotermitis]MQY03522.1 hypothetical protein [Actinomadura macrotermitis]